MTATQPEQKYRGEVAPLRNLSPVLSSRSERREPSETDLAFVHVAQLLWSRYGMTGEVMHLVQEGELMKINPESVDDEGREFLLELRNRNQ